MYICINKSIYKIKAIYRECIARCDFVHRLCEKYIFQRLN